MGQTSPLSSSTHRLITLGQRDSVTVCSDISDYEWLTSSEAAGLLNELAENNSPLHMIIDRLRGQLSANRAHLLLEQVELRHRAAAKFTRANEMYFTKVGLEQATDEWIANYKSSRFAGLRKGAASPPNVVDLCCGIGGDLQALAAVNRVGVDCHPVAALFAAVNTGARIHCDLVDEFELNGFDAWHIDPDRRPDGRRTTKLEFCRPNLEALNRLLTRVPNAAVKLAPATVVPDVWAQNCELEWISRDRECRQLVAWHGKLATAAGQRRATAVHGAKTRSFVGQPNQAVPSAARVDNFVFDLDAAILAAHLKGELAAELRLSALGTGATYLTAPHAVDDALVQCFEVVEVFPVQLRKLSHYLRAHGIGSLEIKKRGVQIDPEKLRCQLKLRGDQAATLLITPVAGKSTAILTRRLFSTPTPPI
jgi:hypothetical protein